MPQVPLFHRGLIGLGFGLVIVWMGIEVSTPVATPLVHPYAADAKAWSGALLSMGIVFFLLGAFCELIVGIFERHEVENTEWDRLEELSGRTHSSRPRKASKRICVTPDELSQIRNLLEELRSR